MNLVCINCPRGCHLTVNKNNDEIIVEGNFCPRGKEYAIKELIHPERTITTTVEITSSIHKRLPVITDKQIDKDKIMDVMKALKDIKVNAPIKRGDIIVENILGSGCNIVASKTIEE